MDSNGAPIAGPSNSPSQRSQSQRSPPIALNKRTSSRNALDNSFNDARTGSPPSTPPPERRRPKKKDKGKQLLQAYACEEGVDKRHSHGLSWSSTTRDSVVDNLLFSLDNLSRPDLHEAEEPEFDRMKHMMPDLPALPPQASTRTAQRARGHTYSSSLSTDYEPTTMSDSPGSLSASPKGRRSNSGSNIGIHHTISGRLRSAKNRASSISSSETQKPTTNGLPAITMDKQEAIDASIMDDISSRLNSNRPARTRRSLSMDQIYGQVNATGRSVLNRGRPVPSVHSKYEGGMDVEVAPEPNIPAGPRKKDNPTATGPVYVNQAGPKSTLRKITTQTDLRSMSNPLPSPPIPPGIRNQASDFVRANSIRGVPSIPTMQDQARSLSHPSDRPPSAKAPASDQKQRPGFFKRVFGGGSSRNNSLPVERTDSLPHAETTGVPARTSSSTAAQSRTSTRQTSKEHPTGMSYPPPTLNKKSSSFFRRRKKSTSEKEAPPPLPVEVNRLKVKGAEPSPSMSSLRKVMDPYLGDDGKPANGLPVPTSKDSSRPITQESSAEDSDNLDIFHTGYTPPVGASLGMRDPLSRSPSVKPKPAADQDSAKTRMKVKKRKPETLIEMNCPTFLDTNLVATPTAAEPTAISPITDISPDDKENHRPVSKASTGDMIIASEKTVSPTEPPSDYLRKPSVVSSTTSSDKADGVFVRPSIEDRPESNKSARLFIQPSVEELLLCGNDELAPITEHSRNVSTNESAKSPPFLSATSEAFASPVHSPITPSTQYHSASSLPLPGVQVDGIELDKKDEAKPVPLPSAINDDGAEYRSRARKIFHGDEEDVTKAEAASWLGERNTLSSRTLIAYMQLFDFAGTNILSALRMLCARLVLRGETQQFDRIISALSTSWCQCNANHGFKAQDVVHTICYSLILLNTDLHLADIGEKMSRSAYVKNTLPTIKRVVADAAPNAFDETIKTTTTSSRPALPWRSDSNNSVPHSPSFPPEQQNSVDQERPVVSKRLSLRPPFDRVNSDGASPDSAGGSASNGLVNQPWTGTVRGWEFEVVTVLKSFFTSIRMDPLPLHGVPIQSEPQPADRNLSVANLGGLKRTGSVVSKASESTSFRSKPGLRTMTMGFQSKYNRSRPKVYPASTLGSSRTSFDDGNSVWSPGQSSTWSKYSFSKTLTSASMQSLGQHLSPTVGDFKHSIGFANALSQAIIREEYAGVGTDSESVSISVPGGLLEDESLALEGAPWAKEGLVKHKHHLEVPGKKAKERSWNECFAVVSKGKLTLFAFNTSTKSQSVSRKTLSKQQGGSRPNTAAAPKVGGGDWMENAEQLDVFVLRQTIASTLPPPGYSKTRPHVWALSLPSGAVHLFQVGTPEIAHEFMSTANYWSARLSKEPLSGGVSNIEYGWSDQVINTALLERPGSPPVTSPPPSIQNRQQQGHMHSNSGGGMPRPSMTSSLRTSLDAGFSSRPKLPGDKVHLTEWSQPTQSMMASQLMEVDQLKQLSAYVGSVEAELARHNDLKGAIELAYSPRHTNYHRAIANWQRKSDHLLREIVKFQTYVDSLNAAQTSKESFYAKRNEQQEVPRPASPTLGVDGLAGVNV